MSGMTKKIARKYMIVVVISAVVCVTLALRGFGRFGWPGTIEGILTFIVVFVILKRQLKKYRMPGTNNLPAK